MAVVKMKQEDQVTIVKLISVDYSVSSATVNKSGALNVGVSQKSTFELSNGEEMELYSNYTEKCSWFPHPDMVDAFKLLRSHLVFFSELPEGKDKDLMQLEEEYTLNIHNEKITPLDKIFVTSFESNGIDVRLSGYKMLNRGKTMPLNPPPVKWNEDGPGVKPYEFADELMHTLEHVKEETLLYKKGKVAPSSPDLFTNQDDDGDEME